MNLKIFYRIIPIILITLILSFSSAVSASAIPTLPGGAADIGPIIPDIPDVPILFLAPSDLSVGAAGETRVNLIWKDNSIDEEGFRIFRREAGGAPYLNIAATGPHLSETMGYVDNSVERGKTYFYKVNAYKTGTTSAYSNEVTVDVPVLACPNGLSVINYTSRSITIAWNDNSGFESGYNINIGREGSMLFNRYTVPADSTSYLFESLTPGVLYWVSVEVFDEEDNKCETEKITMRTPFEVLQPLNAPTDVNANTVTQNKILLSWRDNSDGETGYTVERKEAGDADYVILANLNTNSEVYNDNTVIRDKIYMYRVKVLKDMQYECSEPFTVNTFIPEAPSGLNGVEREDSSYRLTWMNDTDYETAYRVERKTYDGTYSLLGYSGPDTLIYDDHTARPDTVYCYRVCAVNGQLVSGYSNECCLGMQAPPHISPEDSEIPAETPVEDYHENSGGTSVDSGGTSRDSEDSADTGIFDGTQSQWAASELEKAFDHDLTYPGIMNNYKNQITREEFCKIAVKLYEQLSGAIALAGDDPFNDTDDPEILKAYKLQIVMGIGNGQFAPHNKITRQEICVMIMRALDAAIPEVDRSTASVFPFADKNNIAPWAMDSVKFCYKNNIMKGISETEIAPLADITREQAIVLLKRTFEQYMSR
ncbi:MAG TPA: S-layer homology domain-containing protein [Bacillota bacterium]|nr:S-layer homology domain-containing protein [Bacillota bacterium]